MLDPAAHTASELKHPVRDPATPSSKEHPMAPSPYWGTEPISDVTAYPPFDEVLRTYRELRAKNLGLLEEIGEGGLDRPTKAPPPVASTWAC